MARDEDGLCGKCFFRADSKRRVTEFVRLKLERGQDATKGLLCDPQPKHECKQHEGYGVDPAETRIECRDFSATVTV
jgi:hypothetical protein